MIRFEINETAEGVVAPPKGQCKVKDCKRPQFKNKRGHAFCKVHSGLKSEMSRAKFKELVSNNEWAIPAPKGKKTGPTSKKKKWRATKNEILKGVQHA